VTNLLILLLVPLYVLGLFALAWWSDRHAAIGSPRLRAAIWGLSMAVYTGSWIFFSSIGAAARSGWGVLTTYGGPVLAFLILFPLILRIARIVKRENIVSIADFLSARYGKSRAVGTLVTGLALCCSIPFIAQQLRALAMGWSAVQQTENSFLFVLAVAAILGGFVILFGANRPVLTEHNRGLVRVIALESVVKIIMLVLVAGFGLWLVSHVPTENWRNHLAGMATPPQAGINWLSGFLVALAGILCAPRLFYLGFVQNEEADDLIAGRWYLIGYLVLAFLLIPPIVIAGDTLLGPGGSDMYALRIPREFGGELFTVLVFLGAFSCVAAPVMVEAVALSAMVSNEMLLPRLMRLSSYQQPGINIGRVVVNSRRAVICVLLVLGCLYAYFMQQDASLGSMGTVTSFGLVQFLPAFLGGLFWRRGHAWGAIAGLCAGFAIWLYAVAAPQFRDNFGIMPDFVFYFAGRGQFPGLLLGTLMLNMGLYVLFSLLARPRLIDRIQASAFIDARLDDKQKTIKAPELRGTVGDMKALVSQFIGADAAAEAFAELEKTGRKLRDKDKINPEIARSVQRVLAGVVGSSLARRIMGIQLTGDTWEAAETLRVLDDAVQAVGFNRELLQTTLDHLAQGVYVVDRAGNMIAWNARFVELFAFPPGYVHVGQPIGELIRSALADSGVSERDIEAEVELRLAQIRQGIPYDFERMRPDGLVLKSSGSAMPGGRYVTSFTDVTELRRSAHDLKHAKELLEERVNTRTQELTAANAALADAKLRAERISNAQARFLAAASHDLLQPLHAARLFMGALREELPQRLSSAQDLATNADLSIESANRLLRALLNLSRLEVGGVKLEVRPVDVGALLNELEREFEPVALDKGLKLRVVPTQDWVMSDPDLLRSVLQNLIGNAVRYTRSGGVLVGCRRQNGNLRFEVRDSGPGIPESALGVIFQEFSRLPEGAQTGPGAGLGLAIADRVCKLLNHDLTVRSILSKGSVFSVTVPISQTIPSAPSLPVPGSLPSGMRVLCVENDSAVLQSMEALLTRWGAQVATATSMGQAVALSGSWDVILADHHLESDGNGLDLIETMMDRANVLALITADQSEETLARAAEMGVEVIRKPVAPATLRIFLSQALRLRDAAE
jgi:signal transduction histidine kinase/Na+/proline symporter/CheY-like chemotaxis protein